VAGIKENRLIVKILMVTGSFPPAKCGVGEYSYYLARALAATKDRRIGVLTSSDGESPESGIPGVEVFRTVSGWTVGSLIPTLRFISEYRPDVVHIQYPTKGYDGRLPRVLPLFMRLSGIPVVQTWHEHYSDCGALSWLNLLACDALVHVRPDLPSKLPGWVRRVLANTPVRFIPSASTIPLVELDQGRLKRIKKAISPDRPIVCFFGFANPNKGVERLFRIADPALHQLVLLCDLDPANPYHATILRACSEAPWAGHVTVTGFQTADRVAECLAVADAAVFPFPTGAGEWNTSLQATEAAGLFSVATTQDRTRYGYHADRNVFYCGCDQLGEMREALARHLGHRVAPRATSPWNDIALAHDDVYRSVRREASAK
jgi:glycosyltransferase involved in cell wall biosynthesis